MVDGRAALERLIEERGEDFVSLSRLLGKNAAYIQQFIKRGVPRKLAEDDRRVLARYFNVSDEELGGPPAAERPGGGMTVVPRLDVGAAAGAGAFASDERPQSYLAFDPKWLRRVGAGDPRHLSIIRVEGDSMAPTLADGDEILVDRCETVDRLRDGIYVLRRDDALMVKRLALNPATRKVSVTSDNEAYPRWPDCDPDSIDILGRVVWAGRRIP